MADIIVDHMTVQDFGQLISAVPITGRVPIYPYETIERPCCETFDGWTASAGWIEYYNTTDFTHLIHPRATLRRPSVAKQFWGWCNIHSDQYVSINTPIEIIHDQLSLSFYLGFGIETGIYWGWFKAGLGDTFNDAFFNSISSVICQGLGPNPINTCKAQMTVDVSAYIGANTKLWCWLETNRPESEGTATVRLALADIGQVFGAPETIVSGRRRRDITSRVS